VAELAQTARRAARHGQLGLHYARWAHRFEHFGWGTTLGRRQLAGGLDRVRLGAHVQIGPLWRLEALGTFHGAHHEGRIEIGDWTAAEIGLHVAAAREVVIGRDVLIASWVFITDHDHGIAGARPPRHAPLDPPRPVRIGDGCWLGERAIVLPGVELGPRCVVGAGAVVTRSFPAGSVIAGVPGRILRTIEPAQDDAATA
jgi:acetyltransferase-like isoleucine patch superfamily enzyme